MDAEELAEYKRQFEKMRVALTDITCFPRGVSLLVDSILSIANRGLQDENGEPIVTDKT